MNEAVAASFEDDAAAFERLPTLSRKRQRFVDEYLIDLNAKAAAVRAGYKQRSSVNGGFVILQQPEVKAVVNYWVAKIAANLEINKGRILAELAILAFYDPGEFARRPTATVEELGKLPDRLSRCIVSWNLSAAGRVISLKLADKQAALDKLSKVLAMYVEPQAVGEAEEANRPSDRRLAMAVITLIREAAAPMRAKVVEGVMSDLKPGGVTNSPA
jgi:phage terminase small subunit